MQRRRRRRGNCAAVVRTRSSRTIPWPLGSRPTPRCPPLTVSASGSFSALNQRGAAPGPPCRGDIDVAPAESAQLRRRLADQRQREQRGGVTLRAAARLRQQPPSSGALYNGASACLPAIPHGTRDRISFADRPSPRQDYSDVHLLGLFQGPLKIPGVSQKRPNLFAGYQRTSDHNATTQSTIVRQRSSAPATSRGASMRSAHRASDRSTDRSALYRQRDSLESHQPAGRVAASLLSHNPIWIPAAASTFKRRSSACADRTACRRASRNRSISATRCLGSPRTNDDDRRDVRVRLRRRNIGLDARHDGLVDARSISSSRFARGSSSRS
jgi:hypothetical protein